MADVSMTILRFMPSFMGWAIDPIPSNAVDISTYTLIAIIIVNYTASYILEVLFRDNVLTWNPSRSDSIPQVQRQGPRWHCRGHRPPT